MTLLFVDSFDDDMVNRGKYTALGAAGDMTPSTLYGRLGTKGVRLGDDANNRLDTINLSTLGATGSTTVLGFACYVESVGASTNEVFVYAVAGGSFHWNVRLNNDMSIEWNNGAGTAGTVQSSTGAVPLQAWFYFEIKVLHSDTVGTVEIRINGTNVASGTSLDTKGQTQTLPDYLRISGDTPGYVHEMYVDDVYICDGAGTSNNDFLGDSHVELRLPDGNGNSSGMTGSDGNSTDNYLLVDDDPVVTTDYVEATTAATKDTYSMENLDMSSGSIFGVQVCIFQQKDDSGSKFMRPVVRSGSTDYVGTSVALNTSWTPEFQIWEQDPNTSSAWTVSGVNSVEVGQEVRDS